MKEAKKHFSKLGFVYLAGTIFCTAVQYLMIILVMFFKKELFENYDNTYAIPMMGLFLVGYPVFLFLISRIKKPEATMISEKKNSMTVKSFLLAFTMAYLLGIAGNSITLFITYLVGIIKGSNVQNSVTEIMENANMYVFSLFSVLLAPVFEELIFRKFLLDRVRHYGEWCSILLSGLLFGLFHGNLNQFLYAFLLGGFFAYIYLRTNRIGYTILLHMCINFMSSGLGVWAMNLFYNSSNYVIMIVYELIVGVILLIGLVEWILHIKRRSFKFWISPKDLPREERNKVVYANPGMICYMIVWVGMILYNLYA